LRDSFDALVHSLSHFVFCDLRELLDLIKDSDEMTEILKMTLGDQKINANKTLFQSLLCNLLMRFKDFQKESKDARHQKDLLIKGRLP
jgi:hypothetical protein